MVILPLIEGLDNGLALTPPMGWMTWQRYRCITDCQKYPDECISDKLVRRVVDKMISDGYLDVGYEYIIVDDCWMENERDSSGHLVEDKVRFPYGMESLINYVHSNGFKFGIYEDYGRKTCMGYPGMLGHVQKDINKFADWGIDYIKVDGCYNDEVDLSDGYEMLKDALNNTGRPIVYSCSYPAYHDENSIPTDFMKLSKNCNLWRNYDDIQDSWGSVTDILDYFALKQDFIAKYAGPGHWNDPDMLLIGNYGLSYDQSKVQMALWAVLSAPLLMSVNLDTIRPEYAAILKNKKIIQVNQDPLGIQGLRVLRKNKIEVWTKKITPVIGENYSYAVAFYSRRTDGSPQEFNVTLRDIGLNFIGGYKLEVNFIIYNLAI
ncbi:hypothetical protein AAG570_008344 [Ranatra chinensis]|uniref:Alpha-galactosidase n=1 Tax=Ranatra chinensis TaxID=642074 RepID=A0ABD0XSW2_9HEMI